MPSIIGDYDINTRDDLARYMRSAINGMARMTDMKARCQQVRIAFTLVDKYIDWLDERFRHTIVHKLIEFRDSACRYENQMYAEFSYMLEPPETGSVPISRNDTMIQ